MEDHSDEHFRLPLALGIAGHFPNIPFRHPPPIGAGFQPLVAPELRAYARRNYAITAVEALEDTEEAPVGAAGSPV